LLSYPYFHFFQFSSRHVGFSTDVDVTHLWRLHICVRLWTPFPTVYYG
jgi:hypothetical protein